MKYLLLILLIFPILLLADNPCLPDEKGQESKIDSLENLLHGSSGREKLDICLALAKASMNKNVGKSIQYSELALQLSDSLNHWTAMAKAHYYLGQGQKTIGSYDQALNNTSKAEELFKINGQRSLFIDAINLQGTIYQKMSNLDKANERYKTALKELYFLQKQQPDNDTLKKKEVTFRNNLGSILLVKEAFDTALIYYECRKNSKFKKSKLGNTTQICKCH